MKRSSTDANHYSTRLPIKPMKKFIYPLVTQCEEHNLKSFDKRIPKTGNVKSRKQIGKRRNLSEDRVKRSTKAWSQERQRRSEKITGSGLAIIV